LGKPVKVLKGREEIKLFTKGKKLCERVDRMIACSRKMAIEDNETVYMRSGFYHALKYTVYAVNMMLKKTIEQGCMHRYPKAIRAMKEASRKTHFQQLNCIVINLLEAKVLDLRC
jgi:hypothetical protein